MRTKTTIKLAVAGAGLAALVTIVASLASSARPGAATPPAPSPAVGASARPHREPADLPSPGVQRTGVSPAAGAGTAQRPIELVKQPAPGPGPLAAPGSPPIEPGLVEDGRVFEDYAAMVEDFGARTPASLAAVWREASGLNNDIVATTRLGADQKADLLRQLRALESEKAAAFPVPKVVGFARRPLGGPGPGYALEVQYEQR